MVMTENSIQLTNIPEKLSRLWTTEQSQKKIRASLFTFILYVQKKEQVATYQALVKSVISKFPCRVIMVLSDETPNEEYLRTSVSSETLASGDQQVFCEIIQIEVAGPLVGRVPFLILPHILPDLPVYMLWTQDPATESAVLPHLEPIADRIIFESRLTPDLQNYSRAVLSLMNRFHCTIGDLNWSALSGWRALFFHTFDNQESFTSLLQSKIVRIVYNKEMNGKSVHPELEAAYLQAWLASRLNWKFQGVENAEDNFRLIYKRPMGETIILLTPQHNEALPPGSLISVEIESTKNQSHYVFKKHPQTRQVFIQYSDKECCSLPYCSYLSGAQEGQEIVEELFYPSCSEHYRSMLEMLALIPWRKKWS